MENSVVDWLATLRAAAERREWTTLQATLTLLLGELDTFPALALVLERLQRQLQVFQRYHPDHATPSGKPVRDMMVMINAYGYAPDRLPDYLPGDYPTPGSGQFVNAVLEMCRAMQPDRTPPDRFALLTSALANVMLAALSEGWYGSHLTEFQRVRDNRFDEASGSYTDADAARIPLQFWIDPEVAARDTAAWLELADDLERRLLTR